MPSNAGMELSVYLRAVCHSKAINCFVQCGEYENSASYPSGVGLKMDDISMLIQLLFRNSQGALDLTKGFVNTNSDPLIDSKFGKSQPVQK